VSARLRSGVTHLSDVSRNNSPGELLADGTPPPSFAVGNDRIQQVVNVRCGVGLDLRTPSIDIAFRTWLTTPRRGATRASTPIAILKP
jgi:hypothetical protein